MGDVIDLEKFRRRDDEVNKGSTESKSLGASRPPAEKKDTSQGIKDYHIKRVFSALEFRWREPHDIRDTKKLYMDYYKGLKKYSDEKLIEEINKVNPEKITNHLRVMALLDSAIEREIIRPDQLAAEETNKHKEETREDKAESTITGIKLNVDFEGLMHLGAMLNKALEKHKITADRIRETDSYKNKREEMKKFSSHEIVREINIMISTALKETFTNSLAESIAFLDEARDRKIAGDYLL